MQELVFRNGKPVEKERVNGHVYVVEKEDNSIYSKVIYKEEAK